MNTETTNDSADDEFALSQDSKSNLIKLEDAAEVEANGGKDINRKITILDADLALMREELSAINNSVEEGLDRLGDTDTDLRAKVSETYKRLGEIDNAYKALLEISARIDGDINKLNGDVSEVAEQSASGIKNLEISNLEKSHELARKNEQVASRVNELVTTSRMTKELFDERLKATTDNIQKMEHTLVEKINSLAESTSEKDQHIENQVEQNHAKIIKLQQVDEAIIRRATTLEIKSAELTTNSQRLEQSIEALDSSTQSLTGELENLKAQHEELAAAVASNTDMIGMLRSKGDELAENLAALAGIEKRHFTQVTLGMLMLLLVVAAAYFAQQSQFASNDERFVAHADKVENQIANLQQVQSSEKVVTDSSIDDLQSKVETLAAEKDVLRQELTEVKGELNTVGDRVDSVSGRFDNSSLLNGIGSDNVIHGEHWIIEQPAENYAIQLAVIEAKSDMYELAMSNNSRLKDTLSSVEVVNDSGKRFVLLSGNYPTRAIAQQQLDGMSSIYNWQRPTIVQMRDVQRYISSKAN